MPRQLSGAQVCLALVTSLTAAPALAQTVSQTDRTITTSNFSLTWNTGVDTEAITVLDWKGGSNITGTSGLNSCGPDGSPGAVEYFANSYAPPDPEAGGLVLVGGGTVTPAGKLPWLGQILDAGIIQVTVNSNSTNCPPSSVGVNVQTTYRFFNPKSPLVDWFQVQRVFDFTKLAFAHDFRPYMPRLSLPAGYTEVLYPSTLATLQTANVYNCVNGCTGPLTAPAAAPLNPPWDPYQGWFAIHDPATLQGVVIKRESSTNPQGNLIDPQLWIDNDNGQPNTNPSSFLLVSPASGFSGGLVTEVETLCFYNSKIWTPSMIAPLGCRVAQLVVSPATLTFPSQIIGTESLPQTATLANIGILPVKILALAASGHFAQTSDCPKELAAGATCRITVISKPASPGIQSGLITTLNELASGPVPLTLTGLGVAE